jgi:putative spermidine/putrescine transport system ATP-binding protein
VSDLRLEGLAKSYGATVAVEAVDLEVGHGEFVSLLGPSGCGKTTILRMIAGLIEPTAGRIHLGGEDITERPVHKRNLGYVFQSYALFPHMTVAENVAFGLRRRGRPEAEITRRVDRALELVHLQGLGARLPRALSGGQQQRVALARAIVTEPTVLLLDEPLSNLDALLRDAMRVELKRLQQELGITTIFVTHDQAEALTLSDRIAVLNKGRLEQMGAPREIYHRPTTPFVAGFIGRSNFLRGRVSGTELGLDGGGAIPLPAHRIADGTRALVALRQENVRLAADPASGLSGTVQLQSFAGALTQYVVRLDLGPELLADLPAGAPSFAVGARVGVAWSVSDAILLPDDGPAPTPP